MIQLNFEFKFNLEVLQPIATIITPIKRRRIPTVIIPRRVLVRLHMRSHKLAVTRRDVLNYK